MTTRTHQARARRADAEINTLLQNALRIASEEADKLRREAPEVDDWTSRIRLRASVVATRLPVRRGRHA